jgi:hypothetical protein
MTPGNLPLQAGAFVKGLFSYMRGPRFFMGTPFEILEAGLFI